MKLRQKFNIFLGLKEDIMGKGEMVVLSIFSCFYNRLLLTVYNTIQTFNDPETEAFENIVEKGENAGHQHFLLFPQCFLPFPNQFSILQSHLFYRRQMFSIWTTLKFCRLVMSKLYGI